MATIDSSFWSRALATLVGTLAGFILSIALFYISEHVKRSREREKIIGALKREAAFNSNMCDEWLKNLADIRVRVPGGDHQFFHYFAYTRALRSFMQEATKAGILYDLLTDSEFAEVDQALSFLGYHAEQDIIGKITQWKAGTAPSADLLQTLNLHEYAIKRTGKAMAQLQAKASTA